MLQKNFDAELTIKAGVEQVLQDFPFHLLLLLLFQMSQKVLICWSFGFVLVWFFFSQKGTKSDYICFPYPE